MHPIRSKGAACLLALLAAAILAAPPVSAGWRSTASGWRYTDTQGVSARNGFSRINGTWYYFDSSGLMQTGWRKVGGDWYFFDSSGAMQTGWLWNGGKWYYLADSGKMCTGIIEADGEKYCLDENGVMQKHGWVEWQGNRYYLWSNGAILTSAQWSDSTGLYLIDEEGVATQIPTEDRISYTVPQGWRTEDGLGQTVFFPDSYVEWIPHPDRPQQLMYAVPDLIISIEYRPIFEDKAQTPANQWKEETLERIQLLSEDSCYIPRAFRKTRAASRYRESVSVQIDRDLNFGDDDFQEEFLDYVVIRQDDMEYWFRLDGKRELAPEGRKALRALLRSFRINY